MDLRQKLLASFAAEHREHLEAIRSLLATDEANSAADLAEAYRRAHSLKGAARAVDLGAVEALSHRLETLFSKIQDGSRELNAYTLSTIFAVVDAIEDWVATFNSGEEPSEPQSALDQIEAWLANTDDGVFEEAGAQGPNADTEAVPAVKNAPPQSAEPEIDTDAVDEPVPEAKRDIVSETLRIEASQLDRLLRASGVLLEDGIREEAIAADLKSLAELVARLERATSLFRSRFGSILRELDESPAHRRLVSHLSDVDQQVLSLANIAKSISNEQNSITWTIRQHIFDLQDEVVAARMVTAESVFVGFRKMVRDLIRDEGKEADIVLRGMDTVVDRVVLQGLKDGVMHILRNAVSHGIESPEEREAAGKPRKGRILLDVAANSGRVQITVDDDGRGIDFARVRETAIQRDIVDPVTAATLDRSRLCEMLLQAGFSTARTVTNISGRGVGLSAAVEAATRLQGHLEMPEKQEPGSTIIVSVPLRISNQRIAFVSSAGQTFGLQSSAIEKLLRVLPDEIVSVDGSPAVSYLQEILPLRSLASCVGLAEPEQKPGDNAIWVIVVNTGVRRMAFSVTALLYVREAVVKELDGAVPNADLAAGAVLMQDGSVCLVLNILGLINAPILREMTLVNLDTADERNSAVAEILVVDDSITTRTLERSILEAHGYRVRVSVDGLDALKAMREKLPDLIVSDLEMPRLDGLGLLREVKSDQRLANVPFILVTSRDSDDDRNRGLALGANDYIIKGKFDQRNLLSTIERLL